jgi:hypothetical protein
VVDADREDADEARDAAAAAAEDRGRPNEDPPKPENRSCAICAGSAPLASMLAVIQLHDRISHF